MIAKCGHAYVIGLMDCCREKKVDKEPLRGGAGDGEPADPEDTTNIILLFGCPPSNFTPAESTLAKDFFKFVENSADGNGYIALPGNLNFFHTADRKNETLIKVTQPALLQLSEEHQSDLTIEESEKVKGQLFELIHELDGGQSTRILK